MEVKYSPLAKEFLSELREKPKALENLAQAAQLETDCRIATALEAILGTLEDLRDLTRSPRSTSCD